LNANGNVNGNQVNIQGKAQVSAKLECLKTNKVAFETCIRGRGYDTKSQNNDVKSSTKDLIKKMKRCKQCTPPGYQSAQDFQVKLCQKRQDCDNKMTPQCKEQMQKAMCECSKTAFRTCDPNINCNKRQQQQKPRQQCTAVAQTWQNSVDNFNTNTNTQTNTQTNANTQTSTTSDGSDPFAAFLGGGISANPLDFLSGGGASPFSGDLFSQFGGGAGGLDQITGLLSGGGAGLGGLGGGGAGGFDIASLLAGGGGGANIGANVGANAANPVGGLFSQFLGGGKK